MIDYRAYKKRQELRKNLDEGEYKPPEFYIPELQLISVD